MYEPIPSMTLENKISDENAIKEEVRAKKVRENSEREVFERGSMTRDSVPGALFRWYGAWRKRKNKDFTDS